MDIDWDEMEYVEGMSCIFKKGCVILMEKHIKNLMKINILCYISYFLYTWANLNVEMKNWYVLLGVAPYFLVIISSFIAIEPKKEFRGFRFQAFVDLIIRIGALFLNFFLHTFEKFSLLFIVSIVIVIVLLILNIYIENLMYKKAEQYIIKDNFDLNDESNLEEKLNYNLMSKSLLWSIVEIPLLVIVISNISGMNKSNDFRFIMIMSLITVLLISMYFKINFKSTSAFYNDKLKTKKVFIREIFFVSASLLVGIISVSLKLFELSDFINFIIISVEILIIFPILLERSKRVNQINRIKRTMNK